MSEKTYPCIHCGHGNYEIKIVAIKYISSFGTQETEELNGVCDNCQQKVPLDVIDGYGE